MADISSTNGPFHLVNHLGVHIGPFTTALDAAFARQVGNPGEGWNIAHLYDKDEFEVHLTRAAAARGQ